MGSNDRLGHAAPSVRRWRDWIRREPALAGLTYQRLRNVLADRDRGHTEHDRLLGALMRLAQADDSSAGAVVICSLQPGVIARCVRSGHGLSHEDAHAEMTAALWETMRTYPTNSQPEYLASRLLAAAEQRLRDRARSRRRRDRRVVLLEDADFASTVTQDLPAKALMATAVATAVITRSDADLVTETVIEGLDLRVAARQHGLSYEAAKKRRQRALARLAVWLADPAVATGKIGDLERAG